MGTAQPKCLAGCALSRWRDSETDYSHGALPQKRPAAIHPRGWLALAHQPGVDRPLISARVAPLSTLLVWGIGDFWVVFVHSIIP